MLMQLHVIRTLMIGATPLSCVVNGMCDYKLERVYNTVITRKQDEQNVYVNVNLSGCKVCT